jgi:hypothetical protein
MAGAGVSTLVPTGAVAMVPAANGGGGMIGVGQLQQVSGGGPTAREQQVVRRVHR